MYTGPNVNPTGLVFALDASSLRSISGTGNQSYNGAPSVVKNIKNRGEAVTSYNGVRLTNVNYYTAFAIDYPESAYGGAAASRDGITPGFNVTSGGMVFNYGRALNYAVFDNNTQTFVKTTVYDSYIGTGPVDTFVSEYYQMAAQYPNATHIVAGSHRDSYHTAAQYAILRDLGAPSNVDSIIGFSSPEWILVGEPGLGAGNAYGWAFQNYSTNPDQVAHLVFPLPLKGNKNSAFLFDGTDDYISLPTDLMETNGSYTLNAWLKPNGSSWGDNAIPLYNTYSNSSSVGFWHHFGLDNVLRWRHGGSSYTTGDLSGIGLVADTWQMTTITWDRTTLRLYKNGVQTNSTTSASDFTRTSYGGARVGMLNYRSSAADYNWNGQIAAHTVYNRALSATEVAQTFQAYRTRFGI